MDLAVFKCPECGFKEEIEIPKNKCLQFHKCKSCNKLITVPKNSCCIICSYTNKKCPMPHGE